jgi:PleD family two-component response regulator
MGCISDEGIIMHQRRVILLLVDGEVTRAERLAKRLAHLDCEIHVADNGATALLKAHELLPDVVISTADLPILDGYRMLDALRARAETLDIPVMLITEDSSQESIARGWTAGADLCIPRCQGEADVLATLHRALQSLRLGEVSRAKQKGFLSRPNQAII